MFYKQLFAIIAMASAFSAFAMQPMEQAEHPKDLFFLTTVSNLMHDQNTNFVITKYDPASGKTKTIYEGEIPGGQSIHINELGDKLEAKTFAGTFGLNQLADGTALSILKPLPGGQKAKRTQIVPTAGKIKIIIDHDGFADVYKA